ncbi:6-phosphogluconolactonase [Nocardioides terrisoli]|uniref:6-phosphogluconolactonase n=1 Tax=Nocardioides terrisoli TaxID=3388267 RepID=UPI00287B996D|nr:6-phosphogluconolactonase [Nocardioides marmorisolisilvae]
MNPPAQVVRHEDRAALATDVAHRFVDLLADAQASGRIPHVALTGGGIADEIHAEITLIADASGVDWSAVEFWWGDERFVPADSEDRNALQARRVFLDRVHATRVHEMPASDSGAGLDEAARSYGAEIRASGAGVFDVVMLGVGPDGHIASLFPGFPQLEVDDIAVPVTGSPKPPPERISLTLPALNHATEVWFVAADTTPGGSKHDAVEKALAGDPSVPASHVHGRGSTTWFLA